MINGIPVLYSKPMKSSMYPGGSMEAVQAWIGDAAIACDRETPQEWITAIEKLDAADTYAEWSAKSKTHIEAMNLFTEASRIAELVESFSRQNPVVMKVAQQAKQETQRRDGLPVMPKEPLRQVGFGFSNGRLRIQR
jgi:murein L,D-transpeptidase YcbB/YkuD